MAAWLAAGKERAVVSHESALDLLELSDVIPNRIHLTVPRSRRYLRAPLGVAVHTTKRPFGPLDVITREGMRLTSATRTILDAAEEGTAAEQIEMAVRQAVRRGLTTRGMLEAAANERDQSVRRLVLGALGPANP
jgi:predicted transcriptional regulator of viral defense system